MCRLIQEGRWLERAVLAVMGIALGAVAGEARADQIVVASVYNNTVGSNVLDGPIEIAQFDPALGTLTDVEVSINGAASSYWEAFQGPSSTDPASVTYHESLGVTGMDFNFASVTTDTYIENFEAMRTGALPDDLFYGVGHTAHLSNLKDYIGTGSVRFDWLSNSWPDLQTSAEGISFVNQWSTLSGKISVTYTFTPSGIVPEPSGLVLGGLAMLMGAGWSGRTIRRRGASRADVQ